MSASPPPLADALSPETAALVELSAALACREPAALERSLRRAALACSARAVEEVLLQAHLFVGFPVALEALRAWAGLAQRAPGPMEGPVDVAERGRRACERVYAGRYRALRGAVAALHPELDRWVVEHGYGRVLGRPGLSLATRELCIVALLAVWNAPRQLHSHLLGALHAGAEAHEVAAALEIGGRLLPPDEGAAVWALWERVRPRPS